MTTEEQQSKDLIKRITEEIHQREVEIELLRDTVSHIYKHGIPKDFNHETLNLDKF
jgi:hypothetical protein